LGTALGWEFHARGQRSAALTPPFVRAGGASSFSSLHLVRPICCRWPTAADNDHLVRLFLDLQNFEVPAHCLLPTVELCSSAVCGALPPDRPNPGPLRLPGDRRPRSCRVFPSYPRFESIFVGGNLCGQIFVGLPLAGPTWTGCSATSAKQQPGHRRRSRRAPDPMLVEWTHPEQVPLAKVERRMAPDRLTVNCVAAPDVERTVHVYSLAGGRVMDIRARLGDEVAKGQVLLADQQRGPGRWPSRTTRRPRPTKRWRTRRWIARRSLYSHGAWPRRTWSKRRHRAESAGRRGLGAGADPLAGGDWSACQRSSEVEVADRGDHCGGRTRRAARA